MHDVLLSSAANKSNLRVFTDVLSASYATLQAGATGYDKFAQRLRPNVCSQFQRSLSLYTARFLIISAFKLWSVKAVLHPLARTCCACF